ncbi:MAG: glutaredoxin 3 [Parvularculaceae bacterium]
MPKIEIYTRPLCGYCTRAMRLLQSKGAAFEEIEAGFDPDKRREMAERSGGRTTFPQIFIDGAHIGGSDDLMALERAGKLDALLGRSTED